MDCYLILTKNITHKYEAMLQMFGEKAEEAEELKMDIQDLKAMYRQQVITSNMIKLYILQFRLKTCFPNSNNTNQTLPLLLYFIFDLFDYYNYVLCDYKHSQ